MVSVRYELFTRALLERRRVLRAYDGYRREFCPVILGWSKGEEAALAFQFAGESRSGLRPRGEWKRFRLAKVSDLQVREGAWIVGAGHRRAQTCFETVDLDANPQSPYSPRRSSR
jgi:hypothetical protein